jgi:predicted aspartyl protease
MGITRIGMRVCNPADTKRGFQQEFLVDSGAPWSFAPAERLRAIGLAPYGKRTLFLADGTPIVREVGNAFFEFGGVVGASPVVFAEPNDATLLGVVTLEALGFALDPTRQALVPAPMLAVSTFATPPASRSSS